MVRKFQNQNHHQYKDYKLDSCFKLDFKKRKKKILLIIGPYAFFILSKHLSLPSLSPSPLKCFINFDSGI